MRSAVAAMPLTIFSLRRSEEKKRASASVRQVAPASPSSIRLPAASTSGVVKLSPSLLMKSSRLVFCPRTWRGMSMMTGTSLKNQSTVSSMA